MLHSGRLYQRESRYDTRPASLGRTSPVPQGARPRARRAFVTAPAASGQTQETQSGDATPASPRVDVYTTDKPGSDFMAEVLKSLGFEHVGREPGSSFRGLHESFVNYGNNKNPELLTCCHEESSVAMAHGYAKIEGKPMLVMAHGTGRPAARRRWPSTTPTRIASRSTSDPRQHRSTSRGAAATSSGRTAVQDAAAMVPRLHQVRRCAGVARALRGIGRARLQDRDDAAARPRRHRRRRGHAGGRHPGRGSPAPARAEAFSRRRRPPETPAPSRKLARMLVAADNPVIVADARRARRPASAHPRRARRAAAGAGARRPRSSCCG